MNVKDKVWRYLNIDRNAEYKTTDQASLEYLLNQHAEEQRQLCFDRVKKVAIGMYFSSAAMSDNEILSDFEDACLNATGEKE